MEFINYPFLIGFLLGSIVVFIMCGIRLRNISRDYEYQIFCRDQFITSYKLMVDNMDTYIKKIHKECKNGCGDSDVKENSCLDVDLIKITNQMNRS